MMEQQSVQIAFCFNSSPITVIDCKVRCDAVVQKIPPHLASDLESGEEYVFNAIKPEKSIGADIHYYTDTLYRARFDISLSALGIRDIRKIKFCLIPDGRVYLLLDTVNKIYLVWDINYEKDSTIVQRGLVTKEQMDDSIKQFSYRYRVDISSPETEDEKIDSIYESLWDGTKDKLNDGGLMKHHLAGKPKKLALTWHIQKKAYAAYFWFHDEEIKAVFDRFYGPHPDTKTDFILRLDPHKNKYQVQMYRYGLKEPYLVPEDAYELIVFRNKFEAFRSENYNQPSGAWIW